MDCSIAGRIDWSMPDADVEKMEENLIRSILLLLLYFEEIICPP